MKVIALAAPRLTAFTLLLLWCERFKLVWSFPIILAGTCTQHLYGGACIKVLNPFLIWILRTGPYLPLESSAELALPCPHFLLKGAKEMSPPAATSRKNGFLRNYTERVDPPLPFVLATYPKVSSPRAPRRRQRNQPACCGGAAFFFHNKTWTIIPTLGSLRVYVHPWSGTVSFRFLPCSRYPNSRKCVHTPPNWLDEESILANKHTPYTHLGAPLPAYPYKTRVGGSRSYEVPTTRSTLPKRKRCVCQVRFFLVGLGGFDQKCYAYAQDYPSSRKLRGDYFTTTDDRP